CKCSSTAPTRSSFRHYSDELLANVERHRYYLGHRKQSSGPRTARNEGVGSMSRSLSDGDPVWDSTVDVLSRAQDGDRSAVRILMEQTLPPLKHWTHNRIPASGRGAVNTEDLVQDAVLHTLKRLGTFEPRTV